MDYIPYKVKTQFQDHSLSKMSSSRKELIEDYDKEIEKVSEQLKEIEELREMTKFIGINIFCPTRTLSLTPLIFD